MWCICSSVAVLNLGHARVTLIWHLKSDIMDELKRVRLKSQPCDKSTTTKVRLSSTWGGGYTITNSASIKQTYLNREWRITVKTFKDILFFLKRLLSTFAVPLKWKVKVRLHPVKPAAMKEAVTQWEQHVFAILTNASQRLALLCIMKQ